MTKSLRISTYIIPEMGKFIKSLDDNDYILCLKYKGRRHPIGGDRNGAETRNSKTKCSS